MATPESRRAGRQRAKTEAVRRNRDPVDKRAEPYQHTHYYDPVGWDRFDPRTHARSSPILPGSSVQSFGRIRGAPRMPGGMTFVHVRDEAGNEQSVFQKSLSKKRPEPEEGMEKFYPGLFHDRRGE